MLKHLRQLASESLIYGVAGVLSRMLFVLLVPIYTRLFSPEEYGQLSLVVAALAGASLIISLALDNSAHRWFWDTEAADDRKRTIASWLWCQLGLSLLVAGGTTVFAAQIADTLLDRRAAAGYIIIAVWTLPLATFTAVLTNWLRMQRRPWATVIFTLGSSVLHIALAILLAAYLKRGLGGVFEAQLISTLLSALAAAVLLRDWASPRYFNAARLHEMLRYAVPLIPAAIAVWVNSMADRYFIQHYMSTAEVGLFQVGYAVAMGVALGTVAFQQAWGPFSISIHKRDDARRFYAETLVIYLWVACLAAAAVSVLAPEILIVFTTREYYGAWTVVPFLAFSHVMVGLTYIAAVGPGIAKQTAPVGTAMVIAAVANVLLNLVLTPRWGKEGAALSTLLSQTLVPVLLFASAQKIYPIAYSFSKAAIILIWAGAVVWVGLSIRAPEPWAISIKLALLALAVPLSFAVGLLNRDRIDRVLHRGALV